MLKRFALNNNGKDLKDLARQALIVAGSAGLTYLSAHIGDIDLGKASGIIVAGVTIVANYLLSVINQDH